MHNTVLVLHSIFSGEWKLLVFTWLSLFVGDSRNIFKCMRYANIAICICFNVLNTVQRFTATMVGGFHSKASALLIALLGQTV